mgnify:CR=1 FL=1
MIQDMGAPVTMITKKLGEGHPNVIDVITDGSISGVINTVAASASAIRDGFAIRRAAVENRIPCHTSLDTAMAAVETVLLDHNAYDVRCNHEYLTDSSKP